MPEAFWLGNAILDERMVPHYDLEYGTHCDG